MYISIKFHFETTQEYNIENADCEYLWIKLQNPKNKASYIVESLIATQPADMMILLMLLTLASTKLKIKSNFLSFGRFQHKHCPTCDQFFCG